MPRDRNDIYMQERTYERLIERIEASTEIPEGCADDLLGYDRALREDSISLTRRIKCIQNLYTMATFLDKPFRECEREDIAELIKRIEAHGYAERTVYDFKTIIKKFYRWLRDSEDFPEEVKWIKPKKDKNNTLPEEILTEEEIKSLIKHASNVRDKALISTLYESGCRIGEICSLQLKHVSFDKYGAQIVVTGKTGTRRVRLIYSTSYLATWISNHPEKDNPESWLWVGVGTVGRGKPLDYDAIRKMLRVTAERAGIKKSVNPHAFRHARATHLAKNLTEAQMNEMFGWIQGSKVPGVYVHMSGRDVDEALLKLHGLVEGEEEIETQLKAKKCPRCGTISAEKFCSRCGAPLDIKTVIEIEDKAKGIDDKLASLLMDEEVKQLLIRKLKEMV